MGAYRCFCVELQPQFLLLDAVLQVDDHVTFPTWKFTRNLLAVVASWQGQRTRGLLMQTPLHEGDCSGFRAFSWVDQFHTCLGSRGHLRAMSQGCSVTWAIAMEHREEHLVEGPHCEEPLRGPTECHCVTLPIRHSTTMHLLPSAVVAAFAVPLPLSCSGINPPTHSR